MATTNTTTRAEHLQWCKDRALQELEHNGPAQAWASMASDLGKHDETRNHVAIGLGAQMLFGGMLNSHHEMRKFILGFN